MIAALIEQLSLTDALLLVGLVGVGVKTFLETTGKTRTAKLLRDENHDLIDRNKTLERSKAEQAAAHAAVVSEMKAAELLLLARVETLELKVRELESRDQASVLEALAQHEVRAQARADYAEQCASERHDEAITVWKRIAQATEGGTS